MPAYKVTMDVDGEVVTEDINGVADAQEAIKKAVKKHPTLILGVSPYEAQMALDPEPHEHPGQTNIDDRPDKVLSMPTAADGEGAPPWIDPEADLTVPEENLDLNDPEAGLPEAPYNPFEGGGDPANPGTSLDDAALEAELAAMRGPDGSDDAGLDS